MSTAAPLPTAHATTHVPAGLTATDWAQIRSQLALEAIASLNEQAKLTASDPDTNDQFGISVTVKGDTAVALFALATNQPIPFFIIGSILLLFLLTSLRWLAIRRP